VDQFQKQAPFWLLLLGIAALGAGIYGLIDGVVQTPSAALISGTIERADQPGAYWLLTLGYLAAGVTFLLLAYRGYREPRVESEPEPRPARPRWARGLAWIGLVLAATLLAAAAAFNFTLDPIIRIPFVVIFGGGGLMIGLASLGYLLTGRLD